MKHTEAIEVLQEHWGYPAFRGFQEPIVDHILDGKNTIGLLPTGGGKSICYQVPGLVFPGLTIVISPLVALMADQHEGLVRRGIKSYHFKGSYSPRKLDEAFRNLRYGKYKFAFFAPERLHNSLFLEYIKNADISLIAIDEAHCISQWGFDFRPSYLNISVLRDLLPEVPVLALTASATPRVKADLATALQIADAQTFEGPVRRENLHLHLRFTPNKEKQLLRLLDRMEGTGIIYAKTRRTCEMLSALLNENGVHSSYFHAGLSDEGKAKNQTDWIENKVRAMVATTAFGMGIDKGDVNWVIHWDAPDTLEGYYQEVGRGGRSGQTSVAYLLFHQYDIARLQKSMSELPEPEHIEQFYNAFCSHYQIAIGSGEGTSVTFSITELATHLKLPINKVVEYIRLLQQRGLWQFHESANISPQLKLTSSPERWDSLPERDRSLLIAFYRMFPYATENFIRLDIKKVAAHFQLVPSDLIEKFEKLQNRGLLEFTNEQNQSALVFMVPRPSKKALKLPKAFIDSWIESKRERTSKMLDFLQTDRCLFQEIEIYFGQEPGEKCGNCSRCTHNHYPDEAQVLQMRADGLQWDDIWFDLNCSPDDFRN